MTDYFFQCISALGFWYLNLNQVCLFKFGYNILFH